MAGPYDDMESQELVTIIGKSSPGSNKSLVEQVKFIQNNIKGSLNIFKFYEVDDAQKFIDKILFYPRKGCYAFGMGGQNLGNGKMGLLMIVGGKLSADEIKYMQSLFSVFNNAGCDSYNFDPKTEVTVVKTDGTVISSELSKDDAQKMTEAYQHALKGVNFEKEKSWYLAKSEYEMAINTALENDPNRMIYYTNLGVCYAQIGNKNRARENLEIAIKIDPTYKRARENLESINSRK